MSRPLLDPRDQFKPKSGYHRSTYRPEHRSTSKSSNMILDTRTLNSNDFKDAIHKEKSDILSSKTFKKLSKRGRFTHAGRVNIVKDDENGQRMSDHKVFGRRDRESEEDNSQRANSPKHSFVPLRGANHKRAPSPTSYPSRRRNSDNNKRAPSPNPHSPPKSRKKSDLSPGEYIEISSTMSEKNEDELRNERIRSARYKAERDASDLRVRELRAELREKKVKSERDDETIRKLNSEVDKLKAFKNDITEACQKLTSG